MSSDWADAEANRIFDLAVDSPDEDVTKAIIAAALRTAHKVPEGCVEAADGVDRKVLGTLPITADGCVPGLGASVPRVATPQAMTRPWVWIVEFRQVQP